MRQMMRESLAAIADGRDPLCIIRDPEKHVVRFLQKSTMLEERQADADYSMAGGAPGGR